MTQGSRLLLGLTGVCVAGGISAAGLNSVGAEGVETAGVEQHPLWAAAAHSYPVSLLLTAEVAAGMDEVGRGALAGPLVAAAVVLPPGLIVPVGVRLIDSKQLTAAQRMETDRWIRDHALAVVLKSIDVPTINRLGIGWANRMVFGYLMRHFGAGRYLVDGNLSLHDLAPRGSTVTCLCGGDASEPAIAAASIVAKVSRDRLMRSLHPAYPSYGWARNAGYATAEHCAAVVQNGASPHHRTLFLRGLLAESTE
jgi:ribonuclease HII